VVGRRGSELTGEALRLGLETLPLPFRAEWDPVTAFKIARLAKAAKRPVLHAHTAHAASTGRIASLLSGVPYVAHRRVDFPLDGAISRWAKYEPAGRVVAVSEAIRSVLLRSGLEAQKIEVVCDGLPVGAQECRRAGVAEGRFTPARPLERARRRSELAREFNLDGDAAWVGNLAALVPHKDHDNLIAAALVVFLKRPDTIFLIAGEGPEGPRLLSRLKRMNLLGKFILLGQLADPVVLLKSIDVFALSSWGEGMGSVLLEASACGAPIAATSAGGIPEIVEDGRSGLLCPPRNPEALAGAILKLLDDRALAARLSKGALARLPDFGLDRMARQMEAVYERVA
jgi:glycosyltransferase involved in cell wall biosynthesis